MEERVLFIGGSPCSGKSTVAERISEEYGAYYFKVDDFLDEFTARAADRGYPVCKKIMAMTPEEIWMRDPSVQCEEEFLIYQEISELVSEYLKNIDADFIITEGAAYTPEVMGEYKTKEYIAIIPAPDFQITHYKEREWVPYVLEGCSDRQRAFDNWMQRDILFAERVKAECEKKKIPCITNDGRITRDGLTGMVKELFHLK